MKRRIKGVLFDLDGTLLDTSEFIFSAFEHTLAHHDVQILNRQTMGKMMGRALSECYEEFAPGVDPEELMQRHRLFQAGNKHLVKTFPGVPMLLENLKKKSYRIAIVTSRVGSAQESINDTKIANYIDALVDSKSTREHKPHPEPVLKALDELSLQATEAVMVGDGDADILAGKAAGVITIGVSYGMVPLDILKAAKPDYLADSIDEAVKVIESLNG